MARIPLAAARHPVRSLVLGHLLAFAVPWTVWGTLIAEQRGMLTWHIPQALAFWIGLPLACIVGAVAGGGRDRCPGRPRRAGGRHPTPADVLPLGQVPVSLPSRCRAPASGACWHFHSEARWSTCCAGAWAPSCPSP